MFKAVFSGQKTNDRYRANLLDENCIYARTAAATANIYLRRLIQFGDCW